jgi:glycyl-tRNA synthetase beta chain
MSCGDSIVYHRSVRKLQPQSLCMPNFLLEVGTEDLPAGFVGDATQQWQQKIPASLAEQNLTNSGVQIYSTPRRLAILVTGLIEKQADRTEEIKGPPASAAYKDGQLTGAGSGFAKKQGVEASALTIKPTDKGDFVFVTREIPGRLTTEILTELIPQWIFSLEGKRMMRWADGDFKFPRPIRWLVALWGNEVLPVKLVDGVAEVVSDRQSFAHRVLHPEPVQIASPEAYVATMAAASVKVDRAARQKEIEQQILAAASSMNGHTEIYPELLSEVTDLVEFPTAIIGDFEPEFLKVPAEAITTVMVTHQRYFPLFTDESKENLLPHFITVSNGDPAKSAMIAAGNGRVVRARLADGQYFYEADLKIPLADYVTKLETVTFQADLGSVAKKVDRLRTIAKLIADRLSLNPEQKQQIDRTTQLCKADLVTQMVGEFPELQGIMGEKYALAQGELAEVAIGIREHYLPRNAEDNLPSSLTGWVVGIADRLDTLVCIFGLGMIPTGSSDPFALRRAANAVVDMIWQEDLKLDLGELIKTLVTNFHAINGTVAKLSASELIDQLQDFFFKRLRTALQEDRKIDYDLVNAVLPENDAEYGKRGLADLLDLQERALFLQQLRVSGQLETIYPTVNRSAKLSVKGSLDTQTLDPNGLVQPSLFQKKSEQAFYDGLIQLLPQTQAALADVNYQLLVNGLIQITPALTNFFDGDESVLVMDDNPAIQNNRLNMLGILRNHARVLADFGSIVKQ